MQYTKLVTVLFSMWLAGAHNFDIFESGGESFKESHLQTVCVLGPPGTGKTSTAKVLAKMMTQHRRMTDPDAPAAICRILDLSSMLPEDLLGLPWGDVNANTTRYRPHEWLHELCEPGAYGVLVLDDLPAASPALQVAARQLALERRVHEHRLSPGIFILVTGNRREDKSAAATLPAHFRNSVILLTVELSLEEWQEWYAKQDGLNPIVPAFLHWKRGALSKLPKDADKRGAFATPRTWAKLGRVYDVAYETGTTYEMAMGLVGEGLATEFTAFERIRSKIPDPEKVLRNPKVALPDPRQTLDSPDKVVAMVTAISEVSAKWVTGDDLKLRTEAPVMFLRALSWSTQHNREYGSAGLSTYTANGGPKDTIRKAAKANRNDPLISDFIDFLKKVFV